MSQSTLPSFPNPDRAILEQLRDWTITDKPVTVRNLKRMNEVLGWALNEQELLEAVSDLNRHIEKLALVPIRGPQYGRAGQ